VAPASLADIDQSMADAITDLVEGAMGSPWVYLALCAFAAIDAFLPAVPSESLVISAGVFAATGEPNLFAVIGVAALGAFAGDHVSYMIGRTAGGRVLKRAKPGSKKTAALERGGRLLNERGGTIIVVCRYIPGARTAITLSAGALRYPLRSFSLFDGIAALSWGAYSALVGYVGGAAFEEEPFKGLALGLGLALTVTLLVEVIRHLRRRPAPCAA
jgi:membrane-associated protein